MSSGTAGRDWPEALDAFAATLDARERGCAVSWTVPDGLPALPEELRDRARLLVADAARVERVLLLRRAEVSRRTQLLARSAPGQAAHRVDRTA